MAFIMIRVEIGAMSVGDANSLLKPTKPHDGVEQLAIVLDALLAGAKDGQVDVAIRDSTQTITAAGGGSSASYNLK